MRRWLRLTTGLMSLSLKKKPCGAARRQHQGPASGFPPAIRHVRQASTTRSTMPSNMCASYLLTMCRMRISDLMSKMLRQCCAGSVPTPNSIIRRSLILIIMRRNRADRRRGIARTCRCRLTDASWARMSKRCALPHLQPAFSAISIGILTKPISSCFARRAGGGI